jgi:hypothetical protein
MSLQHNHRSMLEIVDPHLLLQSVRRHCKSTYSLPRNILLSMVLVIENAANCESSQLPYTSLTYLYSQCTSLVADSDQVD